MLYAPEPRYITPIDPAAPTEGREIARLAKALGKPLMPWQQRVVTGATEKTESGMYKYSKVLITVPRQSGKTTLVGPVQLHRIMTRPGIKAFFTAQTGKDAHTRMLDLIKFAMGSPLAPLFKPRYAAGSAGLSTPNGSELRAFALGPAAIHGETPHLVTLDEIWKHDEVKGAEIMGAIGPAQATLEGESQTWMISTMGTAASGFMNELVERGRSGAAGLFYAEWSMADGLDPYEPQTWWTFHPALGNTITESYLAGEAADDSFGHGEWMRAYMNRITQSVDPVIAAEDWADLAREPDGIPLRSEIAITYEIADHSDAGVVMATWRDDSNVLCHRVLHAAPGTTWMHDLIVQLHTQWQPAVTGADDGGRTRRLTDQLRRTLGDDAITTTNGKDYATACEAWLALALDRELKHDGSKTLSNGIAHLVLKRMGDITKFSRGDSTGSIAGPSSAAVGAWLYDHREVLEEPVIHT